MIDWANKTPEERHAAATNHWAMKTREERTAIAMKAHATRRRNKELEAAERKERVNRTSAMLNEIDALERRLDALKRAEIMSGVAASLTGSSLLREHEIVRAALPWTRATGVYFLVDGDEVVYVGQAVNVFTRVMEHSRTKKFDRYAYLLCGEEALDVIESLYIHCLRPRLNGNRADGAKLAPISLMGLAGELEVGLT